LFGLLFEEECLFLEEEIKREFVLIDFDQIELGPRLAQSASLSEGEVGLN
jgi:hypothetical protein